VSNSVKRPIFVTVMGWLATIVGIIQVVFGVIVVAKHNDATFLKGVKDLTAQKAMISGISTIVVGVLSLVLSQALLRGSRIARDLFGLVQLAQVGFGIYTILQLDAKYQGSAYGGIGSAVVVLYFLFGTDKARAFFAKR
jgi:hypothetical protein